MTHDIARGLEAAARDDPGPANPIDYRLRVDLAEALVDAGRPAEALAEADAATRLQPQRAEANAARVRALRALGQAEAALAALDDLLARAPSAAAFDARGVMLAEAGRLDESRSAYRAALQIDPRFARAHFGLASLGHVSEAERAGMERLALDPEGLSPTDRLFLLYALAKAYEEAGDFARAFAAGQGGAALRRARGTWDEAAEMQRLAAAAPVAQSQPAEAGDPAVAPIFVFGMPRSGTSLVEQILASHPQVHGLGETEWFADAAARADGAALAAAYLSRLPAAARASPRFVDKSLGNFLHIGALRRAFPAARLVHVRRGALDCCLSCWLTWFSGAMPFAPDLGAIGRYYRGYAELMQAWRAALPVGAMHEIEYERLVADPERETRALLAFCGLAWDPRCLAFHETRRPVQTASLAAVRRPLHGGAVGRADNFAPFLAALREGLETPPPVDIVRAQS
jgi:tetratricopeptide (TPR) repeat protein